MPPSAMQPQERMAALDAVRGFALFGILVANWRGFAWPAEFYPTPSAVLHSTADLRTQLAVDFLFGNKFISLLSLLFGAGFAIQMERARGSAFVPFFWRRLLGLALIGAAHAFLIWWGDILLTYAAAGALLTLSPAVPRLRRGLQAVGRTALSNYILQSVIGTTIHYGYGLGLYGQVGAFHALLFSLAVFAMQMPLSAWYLSRHPVGPAEWLWRRISYGRTVSAA